MRFKYKYRDKNGIAKEGVIVADSQDQVIANFQRSGFTDINVENMQEKSEKLVEVMQLRKFGTKRCPFCNEWVVDLAKKCNYCGKQLNGKKPARSREHKSLVASDFDVTEVFRYLNLALICIAVFSFFLPFVRFRFPVIGAQSISGFSTVFQATQPQDEGLILKDEKMPKIDMVSLEDTVRSKEFENLLGEKSMYSFIPVGLRSGILIFMSLAVVILCFIFKRPLLVLAGAASSFIFSLALMITFLLMNDMLKYLMSPAVKDIENTPFVGLVEFFGHWEKIEPGGAIYLLMITSLLICILSYLEHHHCRRFI